MRKRKGSVKERQLRMQAESKSAREKYSNVIRVENDITQNLLQLKRKFMTVNTFDVERFLKKIH